VCVRARRVAWAWAWWHVRACVHALIRACEFLFLLAADCVHE